MLSPPNVPSKPSCEVGFKVKHLAPPVSRHRRLAAGQPPVSQNGNGRSTAERGSAAVPALARSRRRRRSGGADPSRADGPGVGRKLRMVEAHRYEQKMKLRTSQGRGFFLLNLDLTALDVTRREKRGRMLEPLGWLPLGWFCEPSGPPRIDEVVHPSRVETRTSVQQTAQHVGSFHVPICSARDSKIWKPTPPPAEREREIDLHPP